MTNGTMHRACPVHRLAILTIIFARHLAIWEAPAEGAESDWGEHVSDAK